MSRRPLQELHVNQTHLQNVFSDKNILSEKLFTGKPPIPHGSVKSQQRLHMLRKLIQNRMTALMMQALRKGFLK